MQIIYALLCAKPRLTGLIFLFAGLISVVELWSSYHSGGSFTSNTLTAAPIMLLVGLGAVIEPRLLLSWFPDSERDTEHPIPPRYKLFSVALLVIAVLAGLYLSLVVFKDWKSVPLGRE